MGGGGGGWVPVPPAPPFPPHIVYGGGPSWPCYLPTANAPGYMSGFSLHGQSAAPWADGGRGEATSLFADRGCGRGTDATTPAAVKDRTGAQSSKQEHELKPRQRTDRSPHTTKFDEDKSSVQDQSLCLRPSPMARSLFPPAFFSPPTLPEISRPPDWVLVDRRAYIAKRENATTAQAASSGGGDIVEVSFCLAEPPAISYMCVHCPGLVGHPDSGFSAVPTVVSAVGTFVLLEASFHHGWKREYFLYRAGPGKPWLRCLPNAPTNAFAHGIDPWEISVLPLGGGDGKFGFVVAALVPHLESGYAKTRPPFDLHLFATGDKEWRTVVPRLDQSCEKKVFSHFSSKVILVGGGFLGWVDMWHGILLCNVLAEDPVLRLISLPKPKVARAWKSNPGVIRDITSDGNNQLSFVEIQLPKSPSDDLPPSYFDIAVSDLDSDSDSDTVGPQYVTHGWRATTWKRTLFSPDGDQWSQDCTAHSDDILEGDPACSHLLPELWDAEAGRLSFKNLYSSAPVLSKHNDGVVYMISELNNSDGKEAWVAAFDVRNKRLKALAPFLSKRTSSYEGSCRPCSFSKYLGASFAGSVDRIRSVDHILSVDHNSRVNTLNFLVLVLMSIQDKLMEFDTSLVEESKRRLSHHSMRTASLLASIEAVIQYAPRDDENRVICEEAIAKCLRVLGDLKFFIVSKSNPDLPAESIDVLSSQIYMSHQAIDSLLHFLLPITSSDASFRSTDACLSWGLNLKKESVHD